jgi:hypothetical protein
MNAEWIGNNLCTPEELSFITDHRFFRLSQNYTLKEMFDEYEDEEQSVSQEELHGATYSAGHQEADTEGMLKLSLSKIFALFFEIF